jgi:chromosome segregation ATPase
MSVMKELNDGRRGELEMSEDNHASAIAAATEEVATLRASADRLRASLREAEAAVASAKADATTARANAAAAFDNAEAIRARAAHVESEGSKARHDIDVATSAEAGWYTESMRLHMLCPKPPNLLSPF